MKDELIIIKAIKKAEKNGFEVPDINWAESSYLEEKEKIIFSHDFAKAFWKEEEKFNNPKLFISNGDGTAKRPISGFGWQFHLQQMVLEKESLQYLKQFIK